VGKNANVPPGTNRYLHKPTCLTATRGLRITSQHAEVWYGDRMIALLHPGQITGDDLRRRKLTEVVVVPKGATLVEGEAPDGGSPKRTLRVIIINRNEQQQQKAFSAVAVKGREGFADVELALCEQALYFEDPGMGETGEFWSALSTTAAFEATPFSGLVPTDDDPSYWVQMNVFGGINYFKFIDSQGDLLFVQVMGMYNAAAPLAYEMWIEMWWEFTALEVAIANDPNRPTTPSAILQFKTMLSGDVRTSTRERLGLEMTRAYKTTEGVLGELHVDPVPEAPGRGSRQPEVWGLDG